MEIRSCVFSLAGFLLCIVVVLYCVDVVYAHGGAEHPALPPAVRACHSLPDAEREACYVSLCAGGVTNECAEDLVDAAVLGSGPQFANAVLTDLVRAVSFEVDGYVFARRIGRVFFRNSWLGRDSFMACSGDFQHGCPYGFFDEAIAMIGFQPQVLGGTLCGTFSDDSETVMCYRRVGHIFMKRTDQTLTSALSWCDALSAASQPHCWGGVFTENVDTFLVSRGKRGDGFLDDDPFAPCSTIGVPYREPCYRNHGKYLLSRFDGTLSDISEECSGLEGYAAVCRQSVMDAAADMEYGDYHGDVSAYEQRGRSAPWYRRLIHFILSLFGFDGDGSDAVDL